MKVGGIGGGGNMDRRQTCIRGGKKEGVRKGGVRESERGKAGQARKDRQWEFGKVKRRNEGM